jgi:N-acetylneuraminic acid mutarotase
MMLDYMEITRGVTMDNSAYCIPNGSSTDVWTYDPANNSWIQISNTPGNDHDICAFSVGNELFTGMRASSNFSGGSRLIRYDVTSSESWEYLEFRGQKRRDAASFTIGNRAYILLGRYDDHSPNLFDVWEFNPDWEP